MKKRIFRTKARHSSPSADTIKRLLAETPFLDLPYHFSIDLGELVRRARETPRLRGRAIISYDKFRASFLKQLSPLARLWRGEDFDHVDSSADELITSADFLRQLPKAELTTTRLEEHLARFEAYCTTALDAPEVDTQLARSWVVVALLEPIVRWSFYNKDDLWAKTCVVQTRSRDRPSTNRPSLTKTRTSLGYSNSKTLWCSPIS